MAAEGVRARADAHRRRLVERRAAQASPVRLSGEAAARPSLPPTAPTAVVARRRSRLRPRRARRHTRQRRAASRSPRADHWSAAWEPASCGERAPRRPTAPVTPRARPGRLERGAVVEHDAGAPIRREFGRRRASAAARRSTRASSGGAAAARGRRRSSSRRRRGRAASLTATRASSRRARSCAAAGPHLARGVACASSVEVDESPRAGSAVSPRALVRSAVARRGGDRAGLRAAVGPATSRRSAECARMAAARHSGRRRQPAPTSMYERASLCGAFCRRGCAVTSRAPRSRSPEARPAVGARDRAHPAVRWSRRRAR